MIQNSKFNTSFLRFWPGFWNLGPLCSGGVFIPVSSRLSHRRGVCCKLPRYPRANFARIWWHRICIRDGRKLISLLRKTRRHTTGIVNRKDQCTKNRTLSLNRRLRRLALEKATKVWEMTKDTPLAQQVSVLNALENSVGENFSHLPRPTTPFSLLRKAGNNVRQNAYFSKKKCFGWGRGEGRVV